MTEQVPFIKMHGLGNDFVIIAEEHLPKNINMQVFAAAISDRKTGVGCDQFIVYKDQGASQINMSIYNQDGSGASACGNASRCLSRLIYDNSGNKNITLNVNGRKVTCHYINKDEIEVDMGAVDLNAHWMPSSSELWDLAQRHLIEPKEMLCVDVANPHLVIFSKLSEKDREIIGQNFQKSDLFKDGINVSFATIQDNKILLKVWERGAGFTYACGSGAVATFAAANKLGFVDDSAEIVFELGSLHMQKNGEHVKMRGPAKYVFAGDFLYE